MKYALITIAIFSFILLLGIVAVAKATEPATIYYTTGGVEVIEQLLFQSSCPENSRRWLQDNRKRASDGTICHRWRPFRCTVPDERGEYVEDAVLEELPLSFCPVR